MAIVSVNFQFYILKILKQCFRSRFKKKEVWENINYRNVRELPFDLESLVIFIPIPSLIAWFVACQINGVLGYSTRKQLTALLPQNHLLNVGGEFMADIYVAQR